MYVFMMGHRILSGNMKRQLEVVDMSGMKPCINVRLMDVITRCPKNISVTTKDCLNFINERRRLWVGVMNAK